MNNKIYRFAAFELDFEEAELRRGDSSVRLQDKPLRLLCALLDAPQRIVTREQLRDRMWDSRTVVNFEQGINVAIQKVRNALEDSSDHPQFIETVAKKGYRFLIPVEVITAEPEVMAPTPPEVTTPTAVIQTAAPRRRLGWIAGMVSLVGIIIVSAWVLHGHGATHYQALAVLPMQNLSPEDGQDFLADGITEDLITNLAESLPIKVISRTSVMSYKHSGKSMRAIAKELGVDAVVEGSVARSNGKVSVTVQLIDPGEDRHLWAQVYERRTEDLLSMESELAGAIAGRVTHTLSPAQPKPEVARSVDPALYELELMGRYHWNKRTEPDFAQAKTYFEQAIARDPNYAPGYAGLADVLAMSPMYGPSQYEARMVEAAAQAHHAIELDDSLAQAHAILGFIKLADTKAWGESETEFRRALAIDPSFADAHHWFAYLLFFMGRRDDALVEIAKAQALDPMTAVTNADEGHFLYVTRDYVKARTRLERAIELAPEFGQPHSTRAIMQLETGHAGDAEREARLALKLDPDNPRTQAEVGYVLASIGDSAEANALFASLEELAKRKAASPNFAALVALGLGQFERAMALVKTNVPWNVSGLYALGQWHAFDPLTADARFRQLLTESK
jgi:TolB-like protein/DNA-binding winged helix-turn-helix (wHTH) protein/Tfp pilus assembly protein PilF